MTNITLRQAVLVYNHLMEGQEAVASLLNAPEHVYLDNYHGRRDAAVLLRRLATAIEASVDTPVAENL